MEIKTTISQSQSYNYCEKCGKKLNDSQIVWLEFSNTDGNYYKELPKGHISQGLFAFGRDCAKRPNQS